MKDTTTYEALRWDYATGVGPLHDKGPRCPQGMLVTDDTTDDDRVAVVYERGNPPPEITIDHVAANVHTVRANGVPVAVVARASGPAVSIEEVILVEQCV